MNLKTITSVPLLMGTIVAITLVVSFLAPWAASVAFGQEATQDGLASAGDPTPLEQAFASRSAGGRGKVLRQFGYEVFSTSTSFEQLSPAGLSSHHIIGPGDELIIRLTGAVSGEHTLTVDGAGLVHIPRVGTVPVWGLTLDQARAAIEAAISELYSDVTIYVSPGRLRTLDILVVGAVRHPGRYELSGIPTVMQAILRAGGIGPTGSLRAVHVRRDGKLIATFDLYDLLLQGQQQGDLRLRDGDTIFVPPIGPVVGIAGEVKRPALYELKGEARVSDLIELAEGFAPGAWTEKLLLERLTDPATRTVQQIAIGDLDSFRGSERDLVLQDGDLLYVPSRHFEETVSVSGQVRQPGRFVLWAGMRVSDLIFAAGGLREAAVPHRAELYRPFLGTDKDPEIIPVDLTPLLEAAERAGVQVDEQLDLLLQPGDHLYVWAQGAHLGERTVTLSGEVRYPGRYPIRQGERLYSVIQRAGGFTDKAYLYGAVFTRPSLRARHAKLIEDLVNYERQQLERERARLAEATLTTQEREERWRSLEAREAMLNLMQARVPAGRLIIELSDDPGFAHSPYNVLLEDGDHLHIPAEPGSVLVSGSVYMPEALAYVPGLGVDDYLRQVGGPTRDADVEGIYVIKANGRVETASTGFSEVRQGDVIVVPPRDLTASGY